MFLPGWDYNVLVSIGWGGAASWVQPLEARRMRPTEQAGRPAMARMPDRIGREAAGSWKWRFSPLCGRR